MREIKKLNFKWFFQKQGGIPEHLPDTWTIVNLPYSYNAIDGQDGNADYYRGDASFVKEIFKTDLPDAQRYYVEVNGANSSADLYWNGQKLAHHDGGYSTWRVDITDVIESSNLLTIIVNNDANNFCYPQNADFTFYGGLYRDVNIICLPDSHFDLEYYGGPGIKVTPKLTDGNWLIETEVFVTNSQEDQQIVTRVEKACGCMVGETKQDIHSPISVIPVSDPHLWNGRKDPYLYTVTAELKNGEEILDRVSTRVGLRTFEIHPDRGFILNGSDYPLRGVARHQDRWGVGNALSHQDHEQDMDLIMEGGFTTIRLAHYQHDQYFYDLCDEKGLILWAEIPYISQHMVHGRENTISQMKELLVQNYNHPSIVVWGLSNEITSVSYTKEEEADLIENHKLLNDLCHEFDPTRLTTMAIVSQCPKDHPYIQIPDTVSWNHYFGWYQGSVSEYGSWFDQFHAMYPTLPVGVSEYGCEAPLNWHSSNPQPGDYSEEYQRYYHEECIKAMFTRPYIWATHVWNMFDFGADARNEGGENGQNHKGLIDFKREYKKDSFFAYKAWLSDEPFVHICSKRFVDRVEDTITVTVYSNLPEVELFSNGISLGKKTTPDHFFRFEVSNQGTTILLARAGDCQDQARIRKVSEPNPSYTLQEAGAVLNWWDITEPKGYLSLNSRLQDVCATTNGVQILSENLDGRSPAAWPITAVVGSIGNFTVMKMIGLMGFGPYLTKDDLLDLNQKLNQIQKV